MIDPTPGAAPTMSEYEKARWAELQTYWTREPLSKRVVPVRARTAAESVGAKAVEVVRRAQGAVEQAVPQPVRDWADQLNVEALLPVLEQASNLLDLLNDWVKELSDPEEVLRFHRERGREVQALSDLRLLDLEDLDEQTKWLGLRMRSVGAVEGAGLGALAMIPVPVLGSAAAITLDVVAMQALATAVAMRVCHAYGFDASDPEVDEMIDRIVKGNFLPQAPKVQAVKGAGSAFVDAAGRVRWSEKLRKDHRLMAQVERLLKFLGGGQGVSVARVRMGMPVISVVMGAGVNQQVLASTAVRGRNYAATKHLAQKYGLSLPGRLGKKTDVFDEESLSET